MSIDIQRIWEKEFSLIKQRFVDLMLLCGCKAGLGLYCDLRHYIIPVNLWYGRVRVRVYLWTFWTFILHSSLTMFDRPGMNSVHCLRLLWWRFHKKYNAEALAGLKNNRKLVVKCCAHTLFPNDERGPFYHHPKNSCDKVFFGWGFSSILLQTKHLILS